VAPLQIDLVAQQVHLGQLADAAAPVPLWNRFSRINLPGTVLAGGGDELAVELLEVVAQPAMCLAVEHPQLGNR
jgi:hypothetical protein